MNDSRHGFCNDNVQHEEPACRVVDKVGASARRGGPEEVWKVEQKVQVCEGDLFEGRSVA